MFGKIACSICGMKVDKKTAIKRDVGGITYYFCSNQHANEFEVQHEEPMKHGGAAAHTHGAKGEHSHSGCC